jgi:poly-gamma-glutamate biosynthesis protein PgsC/CapC
VTTLPLAVGIGLAISLMFSEVFGLAAGGMVVPGYIALSLSSPLQVALTVATGFVTFAIVHAISSVAIVYGRRRTVLMILVGYILGAVVHSIGLSTDPHGALEVIGYIIPGLIGIWIERQGLIETVSSLLTASVVVKLILILVTGAELDA